MDLLQQVTAKKINLSEDDLNYIISLYDGEIYKDDFLVGLLYKKLDELKLLNKTIIVITADHGEELYQHNHYFTHGCSLHDSVLRIPLIIRLPDRSIKGKRIDNIVENIDITPTLLDLVGTYYNTSSIQGESFTSLIFSKPPIMDEGYALGERSTNIFTIRTSKWRYIYNPELYQFKCVIGGNNDTYYIAKEELYDIENDPNETTNVVSKFPEIAEFLKEIILSEYQPINESRSGIDVSEEALKELRALGYLV